MACSIRSQVAHQRDDLVATHVTGKLIISENGQKTFIIHQKSAQTFEDFKVRTLRASVQVHANAGRRRQQGAAHAIHLMPNTCKRSDGAQTALNTDLIKMKTQWSVSFTLSVHDMKGSSCNLTSFFPSHVKGRNLKLLHPDLHKLCRILLRDRPTWKGDLISTHTTHKLLKKSRSCQVARAMFDRAKEIHQGVALFPP